jgi:AraC-like DNA-binding protein
MKPYFKKAPCGSCSFVAYERREPALIFHWHYHAEYELTLIVDGQGRRFVGDSVAPYGSGDLVLLGPNMPHSWSSAPPGGRKHGDHRAVVVQFREDFLGPGFFKLQEMSKIARLLQRSSKGLAFGGTQTGRRVAKALTHFPSMEPCRRVVVLLTLLSDLADEEHGMTLVTGGMYPAGRPFEQQRLEAICSYLQEHLAHEIDFPRLSREFCMEQASLCRFFKRATGRTMTTYLNELRVNAAADQLIQTDANILDIALRSGFGNYSNFNRQFKKLKGIGPRALRQQFSPDVTQRMSV